MSGVCRARTLFKRYEKWEIDWRAFSIQIFICTENPVAAQRANSAYNGNGRWIFKIDHFYAQYELFESTKKAANYYNLTVRQWRWSIRSFDTCSIFSNDFFNVIWRKTEVKRKLIFLFIHLCDNNWRNFIFSSKWSLSEVWFTLVIPGC